MAGLSEGERVVSAAAFLVDAESNLGALMEMETGAAAGTGEVDHSGHDMSDTTDGVDHSGHVMPPDTTGGANPASPRR